jgi:hypothetical protein
MHDCPCCGNDVVYSDDVAEYCSCCKAAGCPEASEPEEYSRHPAALSDAPWWVGSCYVPRCGECDTPATLCTDQKWHANCECHVKESANAH